jgi:hypothetical protein
MKSWYTGFLELAFFGIEIFFFVSGALSWVTTNSFLEQMEKAAGGKLSKTTQF